MPGPPPAYQPSFPSDFVEEAEEVASQRTVAHRRWQRARLVLLLQENPAISNVEAGNEVGLSDRRFAFGDVVGRAGTSRWTTSRAADGSPAFPPLEQSSVKAVACELVSETDQPLSRQSTADITRRVNETLHRPMSQSTVWRILDRDVIKPWRYRYWVFPRDEKFAQKAAPILDLYAGIWDGEPLGENDFVLSSDEKTSIQARIRVMKACRRSRVNRSVSNRSTIAVERCNIWRRGTCFAVSCLDVASPRQASLLSGG